MWVAQTLYREAEGWQIEKGERPGEKADVALVFGSNRLLSDRELLAEMRRRCPARLFVGCSTAGEILGTRVYDESLAVSQLFFAETTVRSSLVHVGETAESVLGGRELARSLDAPDLRHIMVFSDGVHVNGSELVRGLAEGLPRHTTVTGGLAGDGERMAETLILHGDEVACRRIAAVAFYGERLQVRCGSYGGWESFGPDRVVTRSRGNVLHEIDGRKALDLYKRYLGDQAEGLPGTALHFPLSLRLWEDECPVTRTVVGIDEKSGGMIFAGDIPEGATVRFMRATLEKLVHGAGLAAGEVEMMKSPESANDCFSLLVSCVGRRLVLRQRVEEEVEAVRDALGAHATLSGFYSYGEICPSGSSGRLCLHNQTMTITSLAEL